MGARRRRSGTAGLAATLAVVCALGTLLSIEGSTDHERSIGPAAQEAVTGAQGTSFASRAGYSAAYPEEVGNARPASGSVPVEVTFVAPLPPPAYRAAVAYFQAKGLQVTSTDPDRLTVGLVGAAVDVGAAFSTDLLAGTFQGAPVVFPAGPPELPGGLESEVAGVVGLSSGFTSFSFGLQPVSHGSGAHAGVVAADASEVTPALAREFYGFSSLYNLTGGYHNATYPVGTSIAIILWGEGYAPSDLESFFGNAQYYPPSFPAPTIVPYPVDGAPAPQNDSVLSPDARAVEELTLDIEWAGSMAPGATLDVVYAPDGPRPSYSPSDAALTAALSKAISLNVSVVTMSFGTLESQDSSLESSWSSLLEEAQTKGITVLAATGDTGGDTTDCSGVPAPEYPSSSPEVVAVGGTDVTVHTGLGGTTTTESAWNDSGGGFSAEFAAPSWQEVGSAAAPIAANGHRGMPDVSATAADNFLFFNGTAMAAAGTSFATPLWAGLVADLDAKWGQALGFFTPSLYHVGAEEPGGEVGIGLADVTGGSNCVGSAGPGWDVVTGWGSPRAAVLYDDLLGSFVNIRLAVDQTTVAPGGSVGVTAQLTNRTSGVPIAGVEVDLSFSADTDLGPCTGTFATAAPTTNATGWVTTRFSVPICYLGEHALLNASVTTTKLYGTSGLRVNVNLLGIVPELAFLEQPPWAYVAYSGIVGAAAVAGAWLGRPKWPSAPPPPPGARAAPPVPPTPAAAPPPPSAGPPVPGPASPETPAPPPPPAGGGSGPLPLPPPS